MLVRRNSVMIAGGRNAGLDWTGLDWSGRLPRETSHRSGANLQLDVNQ